MTVDESKRAPPEWLNADFLTKAIKEGLKQPNLVIKTMNIAPAGAVGDNYASLMYRITLEIQKTESSPIERLSVVCKTLPRGEEVTDFMKEDSIFQKEGKMLLEVMPKINKMLADISPDQEPLSAKCLYFGTDPEEVLILEDLRELDFVLEDRMHGFDLPTATLVLNSLAKYHAASLALLQNNPKYSQDFGKNLWHDDNNDLLKKMIRCSYRALMDEVEDWKDFPEEHRQRLRNLKDHLDEKTKAATVTDEINSLNVLLHGDCWINNMMFTSVEGVKRMRFVDFQICHLNSPALDVVYFIFTSVSKNIRIAKLDDLLNIYHTTFIDTVQKLGVCLPKSFTFDDLKKEFKRRLFFGFIAQMIVYPITITESKDAMDVNDFFNEDDAQHLEKRQKFRIPAFKDMFTLVLPYFIENEAI